MSNFWLLAVGCWQLASMPVGVLRAIRIAAIPPSPLLCAEVTVSMNGADILVTTVVPEVDSVTLSPVATPLI